MRLLIVEDDARLADLVAGRLRELEHTVDVAYDGTEGFHLATSDRFDLAILDVMLPGLDGIGIVRGLRAAGSRMPVILLTARDAVTDRVAGLEAGADDYVVKPFAFEELVARIDAVGRRATAGSRLTIGPLEIDRSARRAWNDGAELELTTTEFDLLACLMANAGRVMTRSDLKDQVWGFHGFDAPTKVVDLYVHYLRRKLGRAADLIRTVRGVGYAMGS